MPQSTCTGFGNYSIAFLQNFLTSREMNCIGGRSSSRTSLRSLQSTHGASRSWPMGEQRRTGYLDCRMTSSGMTATAANCFTPSALAGTTSSLRLADDSSVESLRGVPGGRARMKRSIDHAFATRQPRCSVGSTAADASCQIPVEESCVTLSSQFRNGATLGHGLPTTAWMGAAAP